MDIARDHGGTTANRVRSSLSAMWTWAVMSGLQEANPVALTAKPAPEKSRERVLSDAELKAVWRATDARRDDDRVVRLLLLTGCRRDEAGRMRWSELDGDLWTIGSRRTKNGLPHELPLPALAVAQLPPRRMVRVKRHPELDTPRDTVFGKRTTGFSGWSRCKELLDVRLTEMQVKEFRENNNRAPREDEARLTPWTLHDLRRTLSTWLSEHGEQPHVVEAVLNHVSGAAKRGVAGTYNRAQYREQKRAALARWAEHIAGLVGQDTANVTTMRRG
jgi:integrase